MNKLLITLILMTFTTSQTVDFAHTEPYVEFDWLDEDKKSLTIEFESDISSNNKDYYCYLYNNSQYCPGTGKCEKTLPRVITCEFEGEKCKADGDNPATKYYYKVLCSYSSFSDYNAYSAAASTDIVSDPQITVAVKGGSYIKFSFILLLSLLVL